MALVILLDNSFMPNWQAGITVNLEDPMLSECLADGRATLLEPLPVKEEVEEVKPVEEVKVKKVKKSKEVKE